MALVGGNVTRGREVVVDVTLLGDWRGYSCARARERGTSWW